MASVLQQIIDAGLAQHIVLYSAIALLGVLALNTVAFHIPLIWLDVKVYIKHALFLLPLQNPRPYHSLVPAGSYRGPSMVVLIPQEVIDLVLDWLVEYTPGSSCPGEQPCFCESAYTSIPRNKRDLMACALVCRAFRRRSQHHLFRAAHIFGSQHCMLEQHRFFHDHSHITRSIKNLKIIMPRNYKENSRLVKRTWIRTGRNLSRNIGATVESLCVNFSSQPFYQRAVFLRLLSSKRFLWSNITYIHLQDTQYLPVQMFEALKSLVVLSLCRVDINDTGIVPVHPPHFLPRIRKLRIRHQSIKAVLKLFGVITVEDYQTKGSRSFLDISQLDCLYLEGIDYSANQADIDSLFVVLGSSVSRLIYVTGMSTFSLWIIISNMLTYILSRSYHFIF